MRYEARKSSKFNLVAVALIALLAFAIGAMFLTKTHSVTALALGEQIEETEFEFENTLGSKNGADLSWDDFTYLATLESGHGTVPVTSCSSVTSP